MIDGRAQILRDVALGSVELHPARRWSALVGLALSCSYDLTTVGAWAREAGMCETQLRLRCGLENHTAAEYVRLQRVIRDVALIEGLNKVLTSMATSHRDDGPHH
jgi:hypothetical protein